MRKYIKEETSRIEGKHVIIRDCIYNKGCWPDYIPSDNHLYLRYYHIVTKDVNNLAELIRDPFVCILIF